MLGLSLLEALAIVIAPLIPLFLPGALAVLPGKRQDLLLRGARILTLSLACTTFISLLLALLGISVAWTAAILLIASALGMWQQRHTWYSWENRWQLLTIITPILFVSTLLSLPFLIRQDGLPTGDVQKSIFWAQEILATRHLPNYQRSLAHLNRDPVDFYTPGLHTLTATIMRWSPQPLTSIGMFSIAMAAAVAWLAAALAKEMLPRAMPFGAALLAAFFTLTNLRFLRYVREPGYHYQNLIGEFFLFAFVLFALRLLKKWSWSDVLFASAAAVTLLFTHQFSAFIGAFLVVVLGGSLVFAYRTSIRQYLWHHAAAGAAVALLLIVFIAFAAAFGLHRKIPHLFTADPHLAGLVPSLLEYPLLMGMTWFITGIAGWGLIAWHATRATKKTTPTTVFVVLTAVILALSQGPRLFIDIPPVRALFYSVVPLSITAAYVFTQLWVWIQANSKRGLRTLGTILLAVLVILPASATAFTAFTSTSRAVRTNSTLGGEQLTIIEYIRAAASAPHEAVLIDDYNRRSASWLLLTGQPMYARIAADLQRQMEEARQSPQRYDLYLRQLDYEKIFSLGSRPELIHLMRKHDIRWIVGAAGSSDTSLQHNPELMPVARGDGTVVFEIGREPVCSPEGLCPWLLRTSTLVNDIGDREDTFEHLPASIRAPRLSEPELQGRTTYRVSTAPYIPLRFNVGDYVRILWDKEETTQPDIALEFHLELAAAPPDELSLITPAGTAFPISSRQTTIRLPASEVAFDTQGFITLTLYNPAEQPVAIDLIALGLARVP